MRSLAVISLGSALVVGACGTGQRVGSVEPTPAQPPTPAAGGFSALIAADNGLEVRKWVVQDDAPRIADALRHFGAAVDDESLDAELLRNGFVLVRVHPEDVEPLLEEIGSALSDLRSWHGQATKWRELVRRGARDPVATLVDGRVRVFSDGAVSLMARGWTLPMEDETVMQLEMRAEFDPVSRGYRDLVRSEPPRGEPLGPGTIELEASSDEVWILTCVTPRDDEEVDESDSAEQGVSGASGVSADRAVDDIGPRTDDSIFGPDTQLPQTLGQMLFSSDVPATRTLLVFVPKLPKAEGR